MFNGQFVVGGQVVSGVNTTVRVSRWDGANWITMGSLAGTNMDVLQVIDGSLYAAASGLVFRWNGLGWQAMASGPVHLHEFGFPDTVTALVSKSGVLYAAAGAVLNELSGNTWIAVADQPPVQLDRFVVANGSLIGGATFGGGPIYRWLGPGGGGGWENLLSATTGSTVTVLAENGGVLHALVNNQLARSTARSGRCSACSRAGARSTFCSETQRSSCPATSARWTIWCRRCGRGGLSRRAPTTTARARSRCRTSSTSSPTTSPAALCADFNGSGARTVQDIFDFLAAYFSA